MGRAISLAFNRILECLTCVCVCVVCEIPFKREICPNKWRWPCGVDARLLTAKCRVSIHFFFRLFMEPNEMYLLIINSWNHENISKSSPALSCGRAATWIDWNAGSSFYFVLHQRSQRYMFYAMHVLVQQLSFTVRLRLFLNRDSIHMLSPNLALHSHLSWQQNKNPFNFDLRCAEMCGKAVWNTLVILFIILFMHFSWVPQRKFPFWLICELLRRGI